MDATFDREITSPSIIGHARHWTLHKNKRPLDRYGNPKGWTLPTFWITFDDAVKVLNANPEKFDGVGFIIARDKLREDRQILGGDLDNCRDPVTGVGTKWATDTLKKLNTCVGPSLSGCGYRYFSLGKLPNNLKKVIGSGPQDDPTLTDEMKAHILAAKPDLKDMIARGEKKWNGFELYEDGPKHLTITGEWLAEYPKELQYRQEEILEIIKPFLSKDSKKKTATRTAKVEFDPEEYAEDHGAAVVQTKEWTDPEGGKWRLAILDVCPFNPSHNRREARIGVKEDGTRSFSCFHAACANNDWYALKDLWEPDLRFDDVCDEEEGPKGKTIYKFNHSNTADAILDKLPIAEGVDEGLYYWLGTTWTNKCEAIIHNKIHKLAGKLYNQHGHREVVGALKSLLAFSRVLFNPASLYYLFPAIDGVIDLRTGEARPYKKEDYFTFTYNVYCNHPNPDYRPLLWFLASTLPDIRDCLTVIDLIASVGLRIPFDVFVFLLGGGANGKGVLEKLIMALYTMDRGSAVKIQEVHKSNFAAGKMLNIDYWIVTEVETIKEAMSFIKGVSTGEMIDSDVKYSPDRVKGIPHLLPIIDSNMALDFADQSVGRKRRLIKLDCPYEFGYTSETRPKNENLFEELTTPEVLAGILQIIRARAPSLIKSKKIYQHKSREAQEAELDRQKFSTHYFTDECLTKRTDFLNKPDERFLVHLKVDEAYNEYLEYCKLFNVPIPADKNPFGKYISTKYGVISTVTRENNIQFRYYPGLFLWKSAREAHADFVLMYDQSNRTATGHVSKATGELQEIFSKNNNSNNIATGATGEGVYGDVIEELRLMYDFVHSCKNSQEISYSNFLKGHFRVAPVAERKNGPKDNETASYRDSYSENTPVAEEVNPPRKRASVGAET